MHTLRIPSLIGTPKNGITKSVLEYLNKIY